jgi:hypothetical protein
MLAKDKPSAVIGFGPTATAGFSPNAYATVRFAS